LNRLNLLPDAVRAHRRLRRVQRRCGQLTEVLPRRILTLLVREVDICGMETQISTPSCRPVRNAGINLMCL
jgi:hypothetical protein